MEDCFRDCWSLNSWETYRREASIDEGFYSRHTRCGGVFDCDSFWVGAAVDDVYRIYAPASPEDYVDAVNDYVYGLIQYQLDGGVSQCGERASDLIRRAKSGGGSR